MYRQDENHHTIFWDRFISGDDNALSVIYLEIYDKLLNFGLKFSAEQTLVEDSIQNLFIDLLKNRKKLKEIINIDFYLMKSLRNQIRKEQSKRQRLHITDTIPVNPDNPFFITYSIENKVIEEDTEKMKSEFIDFIKKTLTHHQKEALYLRYNCGFEYKQVAEMLEIDVASARTMVYRSIKAIKEKFDLEEKKEFLFFLAGFLS